jgi:hypothetical protein
MMKEPLSRCFGLDRGTPIDRYYIEQFLSQHRALIRGDVLEVGGDRRYGQKFGTPATYSLLNLTAEAEGDTTIIGDLSRATLLEKVGPFDCIICTQVLNVILDVPQAVLGLAHLLKPGGNVLCSVSGISQVSRYDRERWGHFWGFYPQGALQLFERHFPKVEVNSFGNLPIAVAFLHGRSLEDLLDVETATLDQSDPDYPVTITVRASK